MKKRLPENIPYTFTRELVLRTPAYPFESDLSDELINKLLHNSFFLEAIFFASPALYKECIKLKENLVQDKKEIQKIQLSVAKYYQRMSSRCTPFGLFSGCSVVSWQEDFNKIVLSPVINQRHTRLDMHYLCALSQKIASLSGLEKKLLYFTNDSLYPIGDELRYIEYRFEHSQRSHQVSAVANTEYLQAILQRATTGITLPEAEELLIQQNVTKEEASLFIRELVESQILVSELQPAVTGKELIHQLIETLEKYREGTEGQAALVLNILYQVVNRLKELDAGTHDNIRVLNEIKLLLLSLEVEYDEKKLFQVDFFKPVQSGSVDTRLQNEIYSALGLLNILNTENQNKTLKTFITRFRERYEDATIPLQEALDAETGIGYGEGTGKGISMLTEGLVLPTTTEQVNYNFQKNSLHQLLFEKLLEVSKENRFTIHFTTGELEKSKASWDDLPPSLSVLFRIIDSREGKIIIDSSSGPSAANLLGRFAHGDPGIFDLVNGITLREQELNPGIVFAEIVHLPESRTGNILQRPVLRNYEIPYLAKSALPFENQIHLSDLWISVSGGRVKLFSGKLGKEIVPRLSTAHNYRINALPVYQFLCDLQSQNLRNGLAFRWGDMASQFKFLPRIEYGNIVLHEAMWQFDKVDLGNFISVIENKQPDAIDAFILHWKLPRYFLLTDNDNKLLVDVNNRLSLLAFAKTVKNRESVVLKEFLFDPTGQVTGNDDRVFVHQFIASLVKTEKVYPLAAIQPREALPGNVIRRFEPGSEWLYYKFYCGEQSAEKILTGIIKPLTDKWTRDNLIHKWFFIRYQDPSFHLRLRFHLIDNKNAGRIMNELSEKISESGLSKFIWKIQVDTYFRELERYGPGCIELSEDFFYHDSLYKLSFMERAEGHKRESVRWQWGLAMADAFLNAFELTMEEKQSLLHLLKENFRKEFNADKSLLLQINKKYESNKTNIRCIITKQTCDINESITLIIEEANRFQKNSKLLVSRIKNTLCDNKSLSSLSSIIGSHLHMMFNRLFPSESRLQEYIIYEFLNRFYLSALKHPIE